MSTSDTPPPPSIVRTVGVYLRDLVERVIWTFIAAAAGVAVAAGPADMFHASFWQTLGAAGAAAVVSLIKGLAARAIGNKDSASTAPGV